MPCGSASRCVMPLCDIISKTRAPPGRKPERRRNADHGAESMRGPRRGAPGPVARAPWRCTLAGSRGGGKADHSCRTRNEKYPASKRTLRPLRDGAHGGFLGFSSQRSRAFKSYEAEHGQYDPSRTPSNARRADELRWIHMQPRFKHHRKDYGDGNDRYQLDVPISRVEIFTSRYATATDNRDRQHGQQERSRRYSKNSPSTTLGIGNETADPDAPVATYAGAAPTPTRYPRSEAATKSHKSTATQAKRLVREPRHAQRDQERARHRSRYASQVPFPAEANTSGTVIAANTSGAMVRDRLCQRFSGPNVWALQAVAR